MVLRQCDKIREKITTRFSRVSQSLQERFMKERANSSRSLKESQNACKVATDKLAGQFQKDLKHWTAALKVKVELGKTAFQKAAETSVDGLDGLITFLNYFINNIE